MKKIFSILIITIFISSPFFVFAQEQQNNNSASDSLLPPRDGGSDTGSTTIGIPPPSDADLQTYDYNTNTTVSTPSVNQNSQAYQANYGTTTQGVQFDAASLAGGTGSCAIGSMLASGLQSAITGMFSSVVSSTVSSEVPVEEQKLRGKETGVLLGGYISWDAIGFCLINSIIEYIGTATVEWINSGFQGNPVFVDDPDQFFSDLADIEAGNFLGEISSGYLCSPLQAPVRLNLANSYNNRISNYQNRGQCTFSGTAANLEQFLSGQGGGWQDFVSYQRPQNNTYGATVTAQLELDRRIANAVGRESTLLAWGKGFLSFKDPETGKISSPGTVIEQQLNERLGSAQRRVEIADEFDEIVNALVNQLIKIAISEVTESLNN